MSNKLITIIIPSYKRYRNLDVIINCFLCQTCDDWDILVVNDGPDEIKREQMKKYSDLYNNIKYIETDKRYNDWGHTHREIGLKKSTGKWSLITGDDNYYVPIFIERMKETILENPESGFVYCDFVLDHPRKGICYNKYMDTKIKFTHIDIGSFIFKTDIGKKVGYKHKDFNADWKFVRRYRKRMLENGLKDVKIAQTLYIHN